jgi:hypothetical protein
MKLLRTSKIGAILAIALVGVLALPALVLMGFGSFDSDGIDYSDCAVTVQRLYPIESGEQSSKADEPVCYKTRADYLEVYPERQGLLEGNGMIEGVTTGGEALGDTTVIIGIDYVDSNFGGNQYHWEVPELAGCSDGTSFSVPGMPSGWNDEVSSAKSFVGCDDYIHYENANYGDPTKDCGPDCATMGSMNDETSSECWRRSADAGTWCQF